MPINRQFHGKSLAGNPFRSLIASALSIAVILSTALPARASAYDGSPKLVIILVFDQMRGDYLDRYRADFKAKNGWNLFLKQGAHYTDCYYDYANLVTAAGHATIGTGAYTNGHGIAVNEWWEPGPSGAPRFVESIDDDRYSVIGAPAGAKTSPGASPKNEIASTLGDELVLATGGKAKVFGVSFKDRAAILTSGHTSRFAFWTDHDSGHWISSTYYGKALPSWATAFNDGPRAAQARTEAKAEVGNFYEKVGRTPASVSYQLDFAKALIQGEHLGQNPAGVTDLLTLSISSTDILGHGVGPDSPEMRGMLDSADTQLDAFFSWIDSTVGLQNVTVALTADHGVAPTMASAEAMGMPARSFPSKPLLDAVESELQERFKPKVKTKYVLGAYFPWIQLDPEPFLLQGVKEEDAEAAAALAVQGYFAHLPGAGAQDKAAIGGRLPEPLRTNFVYTAEQLRKGDVPATDEGRRELHSYSSELRWGIHLNFGAYQYVGSETGAAHYSQNSYDRHVPLDFYGAAFEPGTYHNEVEPVDIAATFASLLRINRPSAAVGHMRLEALKRERISNVKRTRK